MEVTLIYTDFIKKTVFIRFRITSFYVKPNRRDILQYAFLLRDHSLDNKLCNIQVDDKAYINFQK